MYAKNKQAAYEYWKQFNKDLKITDIKETTI